MSTISRELTPALGPIDRTVGQSLRDLRLEIGLTHSVMATLLGVAASQLVDYEEARQRALAAFLLTVCERLHVSPRRFYGVPLRAEPIIEAAAPVPEVPRSWTS